MILARLGSALLFAATSVSLVACVTTESRGGIGLQCDKNSECAAPLVCRLGHCRVECNTSEDCIAPAQCVEDGDGRGGCQVPAENECALETDCTDPLVCRFRMCVNACATDRDCPAGQTCREGGACIYDVRARCNTDPDCPGDLICGSDGLCREECRDDRDCVDNDHCQGSPTQCPERVTTCADPDGDGLRSCQVECWTSTECPMTGAVCDGATMTTPGTCRTACRSDDACDGLGGGWRCNMDTLRCDPVIPDPLVSGLTDAGAGDGGGMDGGMDSAVDGGDGGDGATDGSVDATIDSGPAPVRCSGSPLSGVTTLVAGGSQTCAVIAPAAEVLCWGNIDTAAGRPCPVPIPELAGLSITSISLGLAHGCAALDDGTVHCWGRNFDGQLGRGTTSTFETAGPVMDVVGAMGVAAGGNTSCAWRRPGFDSYCWGDNLWGTVGNGCRFCSPVSGNEPTPVAVSAVSQPQDISIEAHGCGFSAGNPACWGRNDNGEAGTLAGIGFSDAVAVYAGTVYAGTANFGPGYSCAIRADGSVECWGANVSGVLGDGTTTNRSTPAPVLGLPSMRATQLALGNHVCALLEDGSVWCWGYGEFGQVIPAAPAADNPTPMRVIASGASQIAVGEQHACALVTGGEVRCWGRNHLGQLGAGNTTARTTVITVGGRL